MYLSRSGPWAAVQRRVDARPNLTVIVRCRGLLRRLPWVPRRRLDKVRGRRRLAPPLAEPGNREESTDDKRQPTHPLRYVQVAYAHLPSEDDPEKVRYGHQQEYRGADVSVGLPVQALPSISISRIRATTFTSKARRVRSWR
jgi:hypothetical protein